MTLYLWTIDPQVESLRATLNGTKLKKYIRDGDKYRKSATPHRAATTNIYKTADGNWFQLHGSLNPDPVLDAIGLPRESAAMNSEEAWKPFMEKVSGFQSEELLKKITSARQAGDICSSFSEYLASEHGKANQEVGLFEIYYVPSNTHKASWWPSSAETSPARPLAGLKVVDLTRIIAAPAMTRGLAELGASVMRVTSTDIPDFSSLHIDLSWGKWNTDLDLRIPEGRRLLRDLILEADVVLNGYRPSVLDKYGFSQDDIINLVADRDRGIISVRENSYGWHGPSSDRPGWQPVSDACVRISHGYGKALGLRDNEPVTPLFPSSDYSTGVAGIVAILSALIQRGEKGGSYKIDIALNYYNQWLAGSCGEYPQAVWEELWNRYERFQFRAEHSMEYTSPKVMKWMGDQGCFREEFFEQRRSGILGVDIRALRSVIGYPNGNVKMKFNIGTRGNATDAPRWPENLLTEIVK